MTSRARCSTLLPEPAICTNRGPNLPHVRTRHPIRRRGGICELCFPGATEEEIAGCAVELDADALEMPFLQQLAGRNPCPRWSPWRWDSEYCVTCGISLCDND